MLQPKAGLIRNLTQVSTKSRHLQTCSCKGGASIAQILDNGPEDASKVVVNGFIRSIRNQKQRSFANVGDGTTTKSLQAILTPEQAARSELGPILITGLSLISFSE